jgi:peptidoglycan/LPS O-acetylase OafA/YrhL
MALCGEEKILDGWADGMNMRSSKALSRVDVVDYVPNHIDGSNPNANTHVGAVRSDKRHFEVLDGLRGIAAAAVLIGHVTALIFGYTIIARKRLAVQFFFMLSGFVIAYAYESRLKTGMSPAEFYLRRVIRLYPLIFVGVLSGTAYFVTFDAHFASAQVNFARPLLAALALPFPAGDFGFGYFPINPPEWSLFYEMLAYALFAIFIAKCSLRNLLIATTIFFGLFGYVALNFASPPFWTESFGVAASFCIGVLLWRAQKRRILLGYKIPFVILAVALLFTCVLPDQFGPGFDTVSISFIFPFVIVCGAAHKQASKGRFMRFLGEISYPLYIMHWPILLFTKRIFLKSFGQIGTAAFACANAIVISWIVFILVDQPIRKRLTERFVAAQ